MSSIFSQGANSVVYRNSIAWWYRAADNRNLRLYDFVLDTFTQITVPQIAGSPWTNSGSSFLHVHQNHLFLAYPDSVSLDLGIWRLDGTSMTFVIAMTPRASNTGVSNSPCLFSDGDDLIAFTNNDAGVRHAGRISGVLPGETPLDTPIDSILSTLPAIINPESCYYPITVLDPDPDQPTDYFWHSDGNYNEGSFNLFRRPSRTITHDPETGGPFVVNDIVTQAVTGAQGRITEVLSGSFRMVQIGSIAFDATNILSGSVSGATAPATSPLTETNVISVGAGVSSANFGLPCVTDGALPRIPTKGSGRPTWDGQPVEILGGKTEWFFRVHGTDVVLNLQMFFSPTEGAPSELATLVNGSLTVVSGSPATTPTIADGATITNVTPDGGVALYKFEHDANADNIGEGQGYTAFLDIA
jgi:hypothetical protein